VSIRELIYRNTSGEEIRLVVPWAEGSGRIPPPEIVFYVDNIAMPFVYQGSA
jgi:hypothetical protein